ncbi:MAG: TIGR02452 family protein [Lachnospiraceae bacterium]|nr:TIGR02452 family protein [Lachnospiraceae bacterium]
MKNLIAVAKETKKITKEGRYELNGHVVTFPEGDRRAVKVYTPEAGETLCKMWPGEPGGNAKVQITTEDSYRAASRFTHPLVMNFANAHHPGGGFEIGATAQEESLCRCSTLYASITSEAAREMYRYNHEHISATESDYMLLSDPVFVFRDENCNFLEKPFHVGVITVPAPNRNGRAMFASADKIAAAMTKRIRIMLAVAKENGYRDLVLGAWGCGAFRNDPVKVAGYFKTVLTDEGYGAYFDNVCFAIYGKEDGKNYTSFREVFGQ